MKGLFTALTVVLVFAAPATAVAGSDVARGNGTRSGDSFEEFSINARSGFDGSQPSGSITFTEPDQDPNQRFRGDVTCLRVVGNQATMSGPLTEKPLGSLSQSFVVRVIDNSELALADQLAFITTSLPPPPAPTCAGTFFLFPAPILRGDIDVTDATS
jgi:hypothetical protein